MYNLKKMLISGDKEREMEVNREGKVLFVDGLAG